MCSHLHVVGSGSLEVVELNELGAAQVFKRFTRKYAILSHFSLHDDWHGVTLATRYGPLSTL